MKAFGKETEGLRRFNMLPRFFFLPSRLRATSFSVSALSPRNGESAEIRSCQVALGSEKMFFLCLAVRSTSFLTVFFLDVFLIF